MVPVKFRLSRPYYKQKTGRVMKKIYIFAMLVFTFAAHGATTPLGQTIELFDGAPGYLINAADAWNSVIGTPMRSGVIASRMSDLNARHEEARLYDVMSVLAFNHTAMTIYQSNMHLNAAYDMADAPILSREVAAARNFVLTPHGIGATDKFEHHKNDDFEMRTGGAGVSAHAYVTDGLAFGVGYTYAKSESHDMPLDATGESNIVTLYSKYLGRGGWYMNAALAAGMTKWNFDKSLAGVSDDTAFNTDLYSGQIKTGMVLGRGRMTIMPEIGMRYMRIVSEKHLDTAAQDFKKWWYNSLDVNAGATMGLGFATGGVMIRPMLSIGAGYAILDKGTDHVTARLITGQSYRMPVHSPARTELRGGGGVEIYGALIGARAEYTLHSRSDYIAHEVRGSIKIAF